MTIIERVLAAMKTSYAKYGFKKDELSKLAQVITKGANLTDDSKDEDITSAVTANEGYAQVMQSVYNRGVSETNDKYRDYIPKPEEPTVPPTPPTEPKPGDNKPSLTLDDVRKLVADGVAAGLKPYKEREEKQRLQSVLTSNAKLKDVPKKFIERYHLDKEEDSDAVADSIVNDWTELKQGLVQSGQFVAAPKKGEEGSGDEDFRKMMESSAKRIQEQQKDNAATAEPQK